MESKLTPLQCYQRDLKKCEFIADPVQIQAVEYTQALFDLLESEQRKRYSLPGRIKHYLRLGNKTPLKGIYFWGGVGRGKTYIVDAFFDCLAFEEKMRIHFHRFMQKVHHELKQLQDIEYPLDIIAGKFAAQNRVICFDEFHVSDITDAMLLGGLLKALFERGIVLVTTSNEHPDQLYWDGLQRERFLPAIDLLKTHTHVVNLDSGIDYRLRYLDRAEIYHSPLDTNSEQMLLENFDHIATDSVRIGSTIEIEDRKIRTERFSSGVVWFDFRAICDGPRGPADYIEIARQYQAVLVANIPQLHESENDMAKRFITLVDEFYDRNVKLIITAAVEPQALYLGKRLARPFRRTVSRLIEMQTHDYLAKQHLSD